MIGKNIIRELFVLLFGLVVSVFNGKCSFPVEIPKMLFGVLGVLFPVALAVATSIDLMRVRNVEYRTEFRKNIRNVRTALITQFVFSVISVFVVIFMNNVHPSLLFQYKGVTIYISINILLTFVIAYSVAHTIYNFISIQKFKEDIEDKLQKEGE